ncbi:hypothetical protein N2152v2_008116 [Parachlorella kessleri]
MGGCVSSHKPEDVAVTKGAAHSAPEPALPAKSIPTCSGTGSGSAPSNASAINVVEQPPQQAQRQLDVPVQQPAPKPEIDSASSIDGPSRRPTLPLESGPWAPPYGLPAARSRDAGSLGDGPLSPESSLNSSSSSMSIPDHVYSSNESSQPPATDPLLKLLLTKMGPAGLSKGHSTAGSGGGSLPPPQGAQTSGQGAGAGGSRSALGSHVSGGAGASRATSSRVGSEELDSAGSQHPAGGGSGSGGSGGGRPPGAISRGGSSEGGKSGPPGPMVSPFISGASSAQQQQQQPGQPGSGSSGGGDAAVATPPGVWVPSQSAQPGDMPTARTGSTVIVTPTPSMTGGASGMSSISSGGVDPKAWTIPFGELQIMKQIGEGSFGRVYMAKWRETLVAVKLLLNTGVNLDDMEAAAELAISLSNPVLLNLQKEASLMAALRHPNIVGFLGVCPTPPCVVSDFCSRGSLNDVLQAAKRSPAKAAQLDWVKRLNMALDAAKGMLYLHLHKPPIIHRDLKSPNLLVDKHWKVKVCDFNLSKIMEDTTSGASMSTNNPRWLAPEVLDGQRATLASDVYSFGVVLWEILTFELPWGRFNQWQIMKMVSEGRRLQVPPRSALPPASQGFEGLGLYEDLIRKCWAGEPGERPTFTEVIADLRELLGVALKAGLGRADEDDRPAAAERQRQQALQPGMQPRAAQHAQQQRYPPGQHAQQGGPGVELEPRPQSEPLLQHPGLGAQAPQGGAEGAGAARVAGALPAPANGAHLSKAAALRRAISMR